MMRRKVLRFFRWFFYWTAACCFFVAMTIGTSGGHGWAPAPAVMALAAAMLAASRGLALLLCERLPWIKVESGSRPDAQERR